MPDALTDTPHSLADVKQNNRRIDREILVLAVPALGALIAEPLFLLTDTAMVGHLGAETLGGLAIASTILQTVLGLMIFLAYATTPRVARFLGAGRVKDAVSAGFDGMWLAVLTSIVLLALGLVFAPALIAAFNPTAEVFAAARTYLMISLWGLPAMLIIIAATGLLRGLQDTKTPLIVATSGFAVNAILNAILIYGLDLGIAGSAWGTVIAQWGMLAVYLVISVRAARKHHASLLPHWQGVWQSARTSGWLLLRNAALRISMLATVFAATGLGVKELATMQIVLTIFSTVSLALDSMAIAGQAMIGKGLGAGDVDWVRTVMRRLNLMGIGAGAVVAVLIALIAPIVGLIFTPDAGIHALLTPALWAFAIGVPLAGYVFVLDGVLMGAGDAKYLGLVGIANTAVYLPILWFAAQWAATEEVWSVGAVWAAFGLGYMAARAISLGLRSRSKAWLVTGA